MKKFLENISLENYSSELIGKEIFLIKLIILNQSLILLFSPIYILKFNKFTEYYHPNSLICSLKDTIQGKILFRINLETKKRITSNFLLKYNFKEFNLEIITGTNFLFTLKEPRIDKISFRPYTFLITSTLTFSGFRKLKGLESDLECSLGFSKINFYLTRIYPTFIKKEINVLNGIKFLDHLNIHSLILSSVSNDSGLNVWSWAFEKNPTFFLQICKLKIFQIENFKFFFNPLNCCINIVIKTFSSLSTFRILFDKNKVFLKFENLGKIEDSLIFSLVSIFWKYDVNPKLIGCFSYGRILLWNELLIPIIQISNNCFSIIDLISKKKSFKYIFILKKNKSLKQEIGGKNFLKSFSQIFLSELNPVKYSKTESFKKNWFLWNMHIEYYTIKPFLMKIFPRRFHLFHKIIFLMFYRKILLSSENNSHINSDKKEILNIKKIENILYRPTILKFCGWKKIMAEKIKFIFLVFGKKRYFTKQEIYFEQFIREIERKNIYFKKCKVCLRSWKFVPNKSDSNYCPFNHIFKNKNIENKKKNSDFNSLSSFNLTPSEKNASFVFEPFFDISKLAKIKGKNFIQKEIDFNSFFSLFNSKTSG